MHNLTNVRGHLSQKIPICNGGKSSSQYLTIPEPKRLLNGKNSQIYNFSQKEGS